jgi:polyphenol oxidase
MSSTKCDVTLLYQAELLLPYQDRVIHGFTGKPASLGGPDTPQNPGAAVQENRQKLLKAFDVPHLTWCIPEQVHGHRVGRTGDKDFAQTDAILLTQPHQPVMLLFADCVPLMLYDPDHHGAAVIHAGWRGTAQGIAKEALQAMQNVFGSNPETILAVIGPAIDVCCFQVSAEVAQTMAASLDLALEDLESLGFLFWDKAYPENPRLNLKAINQFQLSRLSVKQIEILPDCTHCDPNLFSYRRGKDGRNSAFMMLQERPI